MSEELQTTIQLPDAPEGDVSWPQVAVYGLGVVGTIVAAVVLWRFRKPAKALVLLPMVATLAGCSSLDVAFLRLNGDNIEHTKRIYNERAERYQLPDSLKDVDNSFFDEWAKANAEALKAVE